MVFGWVMALGLWNLVKYLVVTSFFRYAWRYWLDVWYECLPLIVQQISIIVRKIEGLATIRIPVIITGARWVFSCTKCTYIPRYIGIGTWKNSSGPCGYNSFFGSFKESLLFCNSVSVFIIRFYRLYRIYLIDSFSETLWKSSESGFCVLCDMTRINFSMLFKISGALK